jgi:hypothetical protein
MIIQRFAAADRILPGLFERRAGRAPHEVAS